jgi:hypothetical protein
MTNEQRVMIATGIKAGRDYKTIAETMGVAEVDVKIFATWWRDRGSPDLTT